MESDTQPQEAPPQEFEAPLPDPAIVIEGDDIILEYGAPLPADGCVKCAAAATHTIDKRLRNPRNPKTWFGKRYHLQVGLCKKHRENYLIAQSLTWSLLAVGLVLFVASILTLHWPGALVGLVAAGISGFFRARVPVWSDSTDPYRVVVKGCGEPYLDELRKHGDPE